MGNIINSYKFASIAPTPTPTPSSTPSAIITSGLTLQYDFANSSSYPGTGTALTDLSPSGNNGTLVNGPVFTSTSPKYLTFDGSNDRIDVGSTLTATDWTIDMWLRKTSNQGADYDRIWGMGSFRFEIALDTSNNIRFYDGGWSTTSININTTWNNLVFAFRNDNGSGLRELKIYLNNSLQQTTIDGRTFASNSLKIGTQQNGGEAATFDLNEVRLYNRQLSSTEITTNYNARLSRFILPTPTVTPTVTNTPSFTPTPSNTPTGATSSYLLDEISTSSIAAYSLRKLRSSYSGSAIRVRRSSDNTEQDIGFDVNGELDTSSISTFCGVSNGYITKWYDQSGNSRDSVQASSSKQPFIYNGSSVYTNNGKPAVYYGTSGNISTSTSYTGTFKYAISVFEITNFRGAVMGTPRRVIEICCNRNSLYVDGNNYMFPSTSYVNDSTAYTNSASNVLPSSQVLVMQTGTPQTGKFANNVIQIGESADGADDFKGYIQELVCFSVDINTVGTDRTDARDNINDFYTIY